RGEDALADGVGIDDAAGTLDAGPVEFRARLPGEMMLARDRAEPGGVIGDAGAGSGGGRDRIVRMRAGIAENVADMDRIAGDGDARQQHRVGEGRAGREPEQDSGGYQ